MTTLRRYLLFFGTDEETYGGWSDFQGSFDTLDAALNAACHARVDNKAEWWEVADMRDGQLCADGEQSIIKDGKEEGK